MGIWNIKTWYILYLSFVDILLPLSCWESEAFEQWGPEQLKSWTVRFNYLRVQGCFQRKNPPGGIVNQQLKKLTKTCKVKDHWLPFIMYNPVKDSLKISILLFKKKPITCFHCKVCGTIISDELDLGKQETAEFNFNTTAKRCVLSFTGKSYPETTQRYFKTDSDVKEYWGWQSLLFVQGLCFIGVSSLSLFLRPI